MILLIKKSVLLTYVIVPNLFLILLHMVNTIILLLGVKTPITGILVTLGMPLIIIALPCWFVFFINCDKQEEKQYKNLGLVSVFLFPLNIIGLIYFFFGYVLSAV